MSLQRWGLVGAIAAGVVCLGIGPSEASRPTGDDGVDEVVVRVARVDQAPTHRTVRLGGVTRAREQGTVGFNLGGRVATRQVEVGDAVTKGQVLATLDARAAHNALRGAEAAVDELVSRRAQVQRDRARLESLAVAGSVTAAELERVRTEEDALAASLGSAEARVAEARRQRGDAVLVAPWDGVVTSVLVEAGEVVAPGTPAVQLSGSGDAEVHVELPEQVWAELDRDAEVVVSLPAFGRQVTGRLTSVADAAASGLFPAVVTVADVPPGVSAEVALQVARDRRGVAVPVSAVVNPSGRAATVFRVDTSHEGLVAVRVPVTPQGLSEDAVLLRGDLAPGDQVVVAGQVRLMDGDRVVAAQVRP